MVETVVYTEAGRQEGKGSSGMAGRKARYAGRRKGAATWKRHSRQAEGRTAVHRGQQKKEKEKVEPAEGSQKAGQKQAGGSRQGKEGMVVGG